MQFTSLDASPFIILWYLFLGFLAIVIVFNILCLVVSLFLRWRTRIYARTTNFKIKRPRKQME